MQTIYFLGFTHFCTQNRKGNFMIGRKTEKSRLARGTTKIQALLRKIRHWTLEEQAKAINQNLRGHYAYYGLGGNIHCLLQVFKNTKKYWRIMLSSRSQKSYITWEKFDKIQTKFPLQPPRLVLPYSRMKSMAVL